MSREYRDQDRESREQRFPSDRSGRQDAHHRDDEWRGESHGESRGSRGRRAEPFEDDSESYYGQGSREQLSGDRGRNGGSGGYGGSSGYGGSGGYGGEGQRRQQGGNRGGAGLGSPGYSDRDESGRGSMGGSGYSQADGSGGGYGGQQGWQGQQGQHGGQHGWQGQQGQQGQYSGKGPKGWSRSDDRLKDDVSEALARHPELDASEIEVECSNGEVTLSGTVRERSAKRMAEDVAEQVFGVNDVHNSIRVKREQNGDASGGDRSENSGSESGAGSAGKSARSGSGRSGQQQS
jgi:osmotically-inducible protein OsmY